MQIKRTVLTDFRNIPYLDITLFPGLNFLVGPNACGKTNTLEAIHVSATGKSFRRTTDRQLIRFHRENTHIRTFVDQDGVEEEITFSLNDDGVKKVSVNGERLSRLRQLRELFQVITFVPDDMKIIQEGHKERRDFMDDGLKKIYPEYALVSNDFQHALSMRNQILKNDRHKPYWTQELRAIDGQMARCAARIMRFRDAFCRKMEILAENIHRTLSDEALSIAYKGFCPVDDQIETRYRKILEKNLERDFFLGYTEQGPHRDTLSIEINHADARDFASRGQIRTAVLSLKLAELELLNFHKTQRPVILLDDIFSELDRHRIEYIMRQIRSYQAIITAAEQNALMDTGHVIEIEKEKKADNALDPREEYMDYIRRQHALYEEKKQRERMENADGYEKRKESE